MNPLRLGASLYVPATRPDLVEIGNGRSSSPVRSIIYCTEDSVGPASLDFAIANLTAALPRLIPGQGPSRFIRPRHPRLLEILLASPGIHNIDGFVLPKVTPRNFKEYWSLLARYEAFWLMPTLETREVFDVRQMRALRNLFCRRGIQERILCLRIGGNDLLQLLGIRRSCQNTIYETAIGPWIAGLIGLFRPYGFHLTAPVFEGIDHPRTLREEVSRDLDHGLCGKTAIHPRQVPVIEDLYRVSQEDLAMAERLLSEGAPAVFQVQGRMCERATHESWASQILQRAEIFGVLPSSKRLVAAAGGAG